MRRLTPVLVAIATFVLALAQISGTLAGGGEVLSFKKISSTQGGLTGPLDDFDFFGISVVGIGDLDLDGVGDIAVGAHWDGDGGPSRGAIWILFLNAAGTVKSEQKISDFFGNFKGHLDDGDRFGSSLAPLGDLDGDGIVELAVGATGDDDGAFGQGAIWILFMRRDGTVRWDQKISATAGNLTADLGGPTRLFGSSLTGIRDLDGNGVGDVAVGVAWDNDGGPQTGAIWILFLESNGTVKTHQKISDFQGNFGGQIDSGDLFGRTLAYLGDIDANGSPEIAVGATLDDDGGNDKGAVWLLSLATNGTVSSYSKISSTSGGFLGPLDVVDRFGISVTPVGDLDCDGVTDIAVGANTDDDGGPDRGSVWILMLNSDGSVKSQQKISDTAGSFGGVLDDLDVFGMSVGAVSELDGSGMPKLAVGATDDDDGGPARGAVWMLTIDGCVLTAAPTTPPALPFTLAQNYPNPFTPRTRIDFALEHDVDVSLAVYNVAGRLVRSLVSRTLPAGFHFADWDGRDSAGQPVASGIYVYRLSTGNLSLTRKAVLLR